MRRVKVLYLNEPGADLFWQDNFVAQFGDRHDLAILDPQRPLVEQFAGIEVVVDEGGSVGTQAMMDAATDARLWQVVGTGLDHVDLAAMRSKGFMVTYCPGPLSGVALAECAVMFMLMLVRQYKRAAGYFRDRRVFAPIVGDLEGRTLLILGFGGSGQALASRAKAMAMRVCALDLHPVDAAVRDRIQPDFVGHPDDLDRLLPECDFLSLHLHLHAKTRHIIDRHRIGLMQPTACIINVARGALVDELALHQALVAGRLGGAGIDVFSDEPPDPTLPVYQLPNVIVSSHIAGETYATAKKRNAAMVENIDRYAEGRPLIYRIDQQRPQ